MENIQELHNEVFEFLEEHRRFNPDFKDLKYTLRKDNFGNKLQEGYWFLGEEGSLILSFWSGVNIYTKQPNIALHFNIYKETIYLEISLEKSDDNLSIQYQEKLAFFRNVFFPEIDFSDFNNEREYFYRKEIGRLEDWQNILIDFISSRKIAIDKSINEYIKKNSLVVNFTEFIDKKEFSRNLNKIKRYQNIREEVEAFENASYNNSNRPFYLQEFEVQNFGAIKNVKINGISKDAGWVFITGANGSGKSLLLKAIALTLGQGIVPRQYINNFEVPNFKAKFFGSNLDNGILERRGNDKKSQNARRTLLTGFAAYGIHRTTIRKNINLAVGNHELSKNGFLESILGDKISPLIDFNKTIQEWTKSEVSREKFHHRKDFFVKALLQTVPGLVDIHFVEKKNNYDTDFFFRYDQSQVFDLSYDQLSSGTKSILSFVADIIVRFYKQQPEAYDPSEFKGVVIVDEIDLHLHPQGQKDLILALIEVFPNIQFIVSTHSPIPLLAAPKNSIVYRIERNSKNGISAKRIDTLIHLEDLLPNTILTSPIFGMDSIVNSNRDNSNRINTQDNYGEVELSQKLKSRINDFLTDRKQEELIRLFENRRK
ncbi:AAA family ATPase [Elizabethkingia sp. S0634]|uniref:AAA family ATPase n=1 Tax=Elizabethkingia sp. S0634 TaxID=2957806 RepID=UPI00209D9C6A|nr:AAA family ATPase [Elizabethkingia sp. S0634]MCP1250823.1 AAA family ATPase [Elizabethkingia sp. S0634]